MRRFVPFLASGLLLAAAWSCLNPRPDEFPSSRGEADSAPRSSLVPGEAASGSNQASPDSSDAVVALDEGDSLDSAPEGVADEADRDPLAPDPSPEPGQPPNASADAGVPGPSEAGLEPPPLDAGADAG